MARILAYIMPFSNMTVLVQRELTVVEITTVITKRKNTQSFLCHFYSQTQVNEIYAIVSFVQLLTDYISPINDDISIPLLLFNWRGVICIVFVYKHCFCEPIV